MSHRLFRQHIVFAQGYDLLLWLQITHTRDRQRIQRNGLQMLLRQYVEQASVPLVTEGTEAVHVVGTRYDLSHCQANKGENVDKPTGRAKPRATQLKHHLMVLDTVHLVCPARHVKLIQRHLEGE